MIKSKVYPEIYNSWVGAKGRCRNPNKKDYYRYGGRGITFSEEWESFDSFLKWSLEHGWEKGLSLDRIDCNKGYSPDNCRWANLEVQENNRRDNVFLTIDGDRKTCRQWCREAGIPHTTMSFWVTKYGEEEAIKRIKATIECGYVVDKSKKGRAVICLETGETFGSVRKACAKLGIERKTATKYIGTGKPYKGFVLDYLEQA